MKITSYMGLMVFAALSILAAAPARADFPTRPIRLVVVYGPGGANDIIARMIGAKMAEILGQPVVIENKPGANGMIGAQHVAKSAPDGYTLLVGGAPLTVVKALFKAPLIDATKDFAPIGKMVDIPIMLVASKDLPIDTFPQLLKESKAEPDRFSMAVTSPVYGLDLERLNAETGMAIRRVDYRGISEAITDVSQGRVDLLLDTIGGQMPYVKAQRTKILAVLSESRQPNLPDVPTMQELGFKGFIDTPFIGLLAPAGTPANIIAKLSSTMTQAVESDEVKQKLAAMEGFVPAPSGAADFGAYLEAGIERNNEIARRANIQKQ